MDGRGLEAPFTELELKRGERVATLLWVFSGALAAILAVWSVGIERMI